MLLGCRIPLKEAIHHQETKEISVSAHTDSTVGIQSLTSAAGVRKDLA